jgi:hypothetical protein
MRGAIFESFVISELYKCFANAGESPPLYFWRDRTGHEVDIVLDFGRELLPVEIKSGETIAGHRGLVGSAILRNLQARGHANFLLRTRTELDLERQADVEALFKIRRFHEAKLRMAAKDDPTSPPLAKDLSRHPPLAKGGQGGFNPSPHPPNPSISPNGSCVQAWATDSPRREFMYSDDMADACVFLMQNYEGSAIVNIGTGENITMTYPAPCASAEPEHLFEGISPDGFHITYCSTRSPRLDIM